MDNAAIFDSDRLVNFLKFTATTVDQAGEHLSGIQPNSGQQETAIAVETALCHLANARNLLQEIVGVYCDHCASEMHRYTDGRPVTSHIRFGEGSEYTQIWHPIASAAWNQPREVATLTTRGGTKKQIVIPAPGHLDAFTITERTEV
jgi:hypothetical protein